MGVGGLDSAVSELESLMSCYNLVVNVSVEYSVGIS
jgi:hypothetical protein